MYFEGNGGGGAAPEEFDADIAGAYIKNFAPMYAVSAATEPRPTGSDWAYTFVAPTALKPYLWFCAKVVRDDDTTWYTTPVMIGMYQAKGEQGDPGVRGLKGDSGEPGGDGLPGNDGEPGISEDLLALIEQYTTQKFFLATGADAHADAFEEVYLVQTGVFTELFTTVAAVYDGTVVKDDVIDLFVFESESEKLAPLSGHIVGTGTLTSLKSTKVVAVQVTVTDADISLLVLEETNAGEDDGDGWMFSTNMRWLNTNSIPLVEE